MQANAVRPSTSGWPAKGGRGLTSQTREQQIFQEAVVFWPKVVWIGCFRPSPTGQTQETEPESRQPVFLRGSSPDECVVTDRRMRTGHPTERRSRRQGRSYFPAAIERFRQAPENIDPASAPTSSTGPLCRNPAPGGNGSHPISARTAIAHRSE